MYAADFLEKGVLETFRGVSFVAPPKLYVGLYINNPTGSGIAGTEISYPDYKRQEITLSLPAPESGGIGVFNSNEITFPEAVADVGIASFIGIFDSITGGNMYVYGEPTEALDIKAKEAPVLLINDALFFSVGNFSINLKTKIFNLLRGTTIQGFTPTIALFNGSPENAGAEIVGANYARQPVQFAAPTPVSGGSTTIISNGDIKFDRATTNWGNYTDLAIMQGATNEVLCYEAHGLRQVKKGRQVHLPSGEVRVSIN